MQIVENNSMTNAKALELFQLLNSIEIKDDTLRGEAQVRTIRSMKNWYIEYQDALLLIDINNCSTKNENGVTKLVKETIKKKQGINETEDRIFVFSKDQEIERGKQIKKLLNTPISVPFKIYTTTDDIGLNTYQKISLEELGFLITKPKDKKLENVNTDNSPISI